MNFRILPVHKRRLLIGCPFPQIADSTFATVPHEKRKGVHFLWKCHTVRSRFKTQLIQFKMNKTGLHDWKGRLVTQLNSSVIRNEIGKWVNRSVNGIEFLKSR